jgi:hypothetical protein
MNTTAIRTMIASCLVMTIGCAAEPIEDERLSPSSGKADHADAYFSLSNTIAASRWIVECNEWFWSSCDFRVVVSIDELYYENSSSLTETLREHAFDLNEGVAYKKDLIYLDVFNRTTRELASRVIVPIELEVDADGVVVDVTEAPAVSVRGGASDEFEIYLLLHPERSDQFGVIKEVSGFLSVEFD